MQFIVGTSGYSYAGWKGTFYPPKLKQEEMLKFYGQQFSTVELNNTYYRLPTASTVETWAGQVPASFQFAVKAPQTITHRKRLRNVAAEYDEFVRIASVLKKKLGPLFFQLPPNFKKDLPRLQEFLRLFKGRTTAAFEFRHETWFDDEVFECLRTHRCPLCIADVDDAPAPKIVATADWGYVRLRRDNYTRPQLVKWIEKLRAQKWRKVYVYFKHDDVGVGPRLAAQFLKLANG